MKKIIVFITSLIIVFNAFVFAMATEETFVLKTIDHPNGVTHYKSNEYVEIIKDYETAYSEMRGVWVATVYNIAISEQDGVSEKAIEKYKTEFLEILDRMNSYGMNTLFFQVRPSNDAFYQSELNPWSEFLAGAGVYPGWDPLEWMVEETHKRGYTFMCWMNAFRVTTSTYVSTGSAYTNTPEKLVEMKLAAINKLADGNFAKEHPEYVVAGTHDPKLILNPSEPAVQKFIVDTIMEIVENYDVDGLHFDDYFYLNGETSSDTSNTNFAGGDSYKLSGRNILNDWPNYNKYLQDPKNYGKDVFGEDGIYGMESGLNLGEFRRENINNMMRNIRKSIDEYNEKTGKCVEFGTKPAAVWRSNSEYCKAGSYRCSEYGSNTAEYAYSTYADLYADSLKWVEEGLVDWVAPQIYYAFEDLYAPYADVVDWWAAQVERINAERNKLGQKDIRLYIAHGIYKYRDEPAQFENINEIVNQIKYNKHYDVIKGSAVYSYEILYKPLNDTVTSKYPNAETVRKSAMYAFKTLWKEQTYPLEVGENDSEGLKVDEYFVKEHEDGKISINFNSVQNARAFGIYKVPNEVVTSTGFNDQMIEYREGVVYSGYEEGKKVVIDLGAPDNDYTYYLVPVSKNGYVSKEYTSIDLSLKKPNEAPLTSEIILDNYNSEFKSGSTISGYFNVPVDPNNDNITYRIVLVEDGFTSSINTTLNIVDDKIHFAWDSFLIESYNCKFKVIVSDGYLTAESYSQSFDLVNNIKPKPVEISIDKTEYKHTDTVEVSFSEIVDQDTADLLVNVYLVIDGEKTLINDKYNSSINNKFNIELPKTNSDNCYIQFELNDGTSVVISKSNVFKLIFVNNKPTGGNIVLNKDSYSPEQIVEGTFELPIDIDNDALTFKIYYVSNNKKEEVTEVNGNKFEYILSNEESNDSYFEMIVSDGTDEISVKSNLLTIKQVETNEKGCKSCHKDQMLIWQSLTLLTATLLIILRKSKNR